MNGTGNRATVQRRISLPVAGGIAVAAALVLAGCNNTVVQSNKADINNETKFSSKEFGVKGSPRVTVTKNVKKGGGRYQVGKPYKIKGKWYTPKEDTTYAATGKASWYGPNFHGRLTANGEVYDQYHLSAAHPTLPLPSYVRVTNLKNDHSVVVRVNDRGPFAHNRIIDLSKKAAEMLDFKHSGVTDVRVEYVGKARMDGLDQKFLLASYRGPGAPRIAPGATRPGTMLALAGPKRPAPPGNVASEQAFALTALGVPVPVQRPGSAAMSGLPFPVAQPVAVRRPFLTAAVEPLSYTAQDRVNLRIDAAFAAFDKPARRQTEPAAARSSTIHVAEFSTQEAARHAAQSLSRLGLVAIEAGHAGAKAVWTLRMVTGRDVAPSVLAKLKSRGFRDAAAIH